MGYYVPSLCGRPTLTVANAVRDSYWEYYKPMQLGTTRLVFCREHAEAVAAEQGMSKDAWDFEARVERGVRYMTGKALG